MHDIFDYLEWRGDLHFSQVAPNPVDFLIFSTLSYVQFDGIVPNTPTGRITLREAAEQFFMQEELEEKVRVKKDLELLRAAADSTRFGEVPMTFYRSVFDPEQELQFAAMTWLLGDGTAVVSFRGTDRTLVGWKEDFNMTFQDSVPAQREASKYIDELAIHTLDPLRLTGHSKGGNLAVYAAAKSEPCIQSRMVEIHNQDGPGFSEAMMTDPGYLAIVPKILTYVPESSVVGMLLAHEEPYQVIKSRQIGVMQHDPYSWIVTCNDFVYLDEISESSRLLDQAMKAWMASMTVEERNLLVDVIYEALSSGGAVKVGDLIHLRQLGKSIKLLAGDEKTRVMITERLGDLFDSIGETQKKIHG